MTKKLAASFIGGLIISVIALYFAFKNVPLAELFSYLISINYFWILPAAALVLFCFVLRAWRWRIILESLNKIGIWRAYHPMMIGFMINCVLPGRLGEVARPVILQQKEKVPFSTGLATVVAERIFDICILLLLFMLTVGMLQINPDQNVIFGSYNLNLETLQTVFKGLLQLGALLIIGVVLFSLGKIRKIIYSTIRYAPELLFFTGEEFKASVRRKICEPIIGILKNIARGFVLIRSPKKLLSCAALSILIWGLSAYSYYLFSLGCPGIKLTYLEMATVMVIVCFFISLPSVPGWWGLWEAGGIFALSLFGVTAKEAAGFTLANHAIQIFPVIIAGFASAMLLSVNIRQMSYQGKEYKKQHPPANDELE
jgi:uncharacterized protein (TIRG00374 family)